MNRITQSELSEAAEAVAQMIAPMTKLEPALTPGLAVLGR
jgi:hypothetical protein